MRAEGAHDADLTCALERGHHHGVDHADCRHQKCDSADATEHRADDGESRCLRINLFLAGAIRAAGEIVWTVDDAVAALIRLRDRRSAS